ncbi:inhibitor of KinA [Pelosinus propionicus DSM 13327]|uniref:Inhibitor of KinA n=1 Tax=Pelosinus propionicus DSM 13327 TaxID=1123291 RepID=A0A1I4MG69_9FIRM|nr:inhibitor of KinA [Pelosinus propionicus DSM 13327]
MSESIKNEISDAKILPFGESAILIEFGKGIDPEIHSRVKVFTEDLDLNPLPAMIEYVSAFSSVTIFYNPMKVRKMQKDVPEEKSLLTFEIVAAMVREKLCKLERGADYTPRIVEIPVCYGEEFGPDLQYVAECNKLTVDEVIHIHSHGEYLVYMIGFAPGFPYLGGMSETIATPRRQSPRMSIPAGSVGIAGMQTGVYPIATPGGWQLIGNTPVELFRLQDNPPTLLQSGDRIRFYPISRKEYEEYKGGRS